MVALFGVAEAFVAGIVFAVYVLYCGVPLRHKAGEEGVYGFVGGFYGACGFLYVYEECVALYVGYGECADMAVHFEQCAVEVRA